MADIVKKVNWLIGKVRGLEKSSSMTEAPSDNKTYGRKNKTWAEVTGGGGVPSVPEQGGVVWKAATSYLVGDVVSYLGQLYVAKINNSGSQPDNHQNEWEHAGERGGIAYDMTKTYQAQDVVSYNGNLIVSQQVNPPSTTPAANKWKRVTHDTGIAWNSVFTYKKGDMVSSSGVIYVSIADSNINYPPLTSPSQWNTALLSDGSVKMSAAYTPSDDRDIATVHFVKNLFTYDYIKLPNQLVVAGVAWEDAMVLTTPSRVPGVYEIKWELLFTMNTVSKSAKFRYSIDDGATWSILTREIKDKTNENTIDIWFPHLISSAQEFKIKVQVAKEVAGSVMKCKYGSIVVKRVK